MNTNLIDPAQWAQNEFGFAQLGDQRRNKRLVNIAEHLAANPGGTLPQAFPEWAELKAAYRFFGQRGVSFERVLAPHLDRTRQACAQPGEYLLIEDTTILDYSSHYSAQGLGVIGDGRGRGFDLHSALAVRVEGWTLEQRPEGMLVGLFDQQCRTPRPAPKGEKRGERLSRPRKSQTWAAAFKSAGSPPRGSQWIYIADRESDFYEPMHICQQHGVDSVIRASHNRRLAEEDGHLFAALAQAPVLGRSTVEVRSRGGQPARTAIVELRSVRVNLDGPWRPGGWQPPLPNMGAVEVREVDAPEGVTEPLHWILLTSMPCSTRTEAQRVVGRYAARWWIEEYHKALKTGAGVEESQLERADRLEPLIAVLAVVAVRLLSTKMLARSRPESFEAAMSFGPEMLAVLEKKLGKPQDGWNNRNVIVATARLGGFLARKHDGMPGWQTIWRGWQRLIWMCEELATLTNQ
ncbi:MAG TPA: IS4 family transposase [Candidatus Saccharimonadales bacterium]|nr:IS4 family transposase [Candidatus Saccharimonadales bacterium]